MSGEGGGKVSRVCGKDKDKRETWERNRERILQEDVDRLMPVLHSGQEAGDGHEAGGGVEEGRTEKKRGRGRTEESEGALRVRGHRGKCQCWSGWRDRKR